MSKRKAGDRRRQAGFSSGPRKPLIEVRGRLGKVQKSKKHRGVRPVAASSTDFYEKPVLERAPLRKEDDDINSAPTSTEQELPYKVKMIMKFKQQETDKVHSRKRNMDSRPGRDVNADSGQRSWHTRPEPVFKKGPREGDRAFLYRVEREAQAALTKSKLENKFKVTFTEEGGVLKVKKESKRREKNARFRKEKRQQDVTKRKERVLKDHDGFGKLKDNIRFGEVVHAPPQLKVKPRNAKVNTSTASKVHGLKLMSLLNKEQHDQTRQPPSCRPVIPKTPAQQQRLDAERERVIALYRQMKAKKLLDRNSTISNSTT